MNRWRSLFTAVAFFPVLAPAAEPPQPLAAAARELASKLPAGEIVTAEKIGEKLEIALAGHQEPAAVAPERILFEIGSITKVFTSLLLAQAIVEKKVTLDTTIGGILGDAVTFADPRVGAITLGQLATHTSGLPRLPANLEKGANPKDPYAHFDRERLLLGLAKTTLAGDAPFQSSYSNFGVGLLGDLLSRVYAQPWERLIAEKVTGPLGLGDTAATLSEEQKTRLAPAYVGAAPGQPWHLSALSGAGALHSSAHDLLLFGEALLHPEKSPLADALALLLRPHTAAGDIGLGILISHLDGHGVYEHGGATGSFRSMLQVTPATSSIRVVLINNDALGAETVLAAARKEKPRVLDSGKVLTETAAAAFEGVYKINEQAHFTVIHHGDELWSRLTGQPFFRLFPHEDDDRFFLKVVAAEMQFQRADGRITGVTLHQNGREMPAQKTDAPVPAVLFRPPSELKAYTGRYALKPGVIFTIKLVEQTLYAQLTGQPFAPVFETKPDWFEYDIVPAALEFERAGDGYITGVKVHQNGTIVPAAKQP